MIKSKHIKQLEQCLEKSRCSINAGNCGSCLTSSPIRAPHTAWGPGRITVTLDLCHNFPGLLPLHSPSILVQVGFLPSTWRTLVCLLFPANFSYVLQDSAPAHLLWENLLNLHLPVVGASLLCSANSCA